MYDESSEQKFPFKNQAYLSKKKEQKQVKSSKQNKTIRNLCLNEMTQFPERLNYLHLDAPPSIKPAKKYCDITGFEGKYKDKSTGLFYADKFVYAYLKKLPKTAIESYLALRKGAAMSLK